MYSSQGNRGMPFEEEIIFTNQQYVQRKVAYIEKVPTPIKVLQLDSQGRIKDGFFEKKGQVDFAGTYQGHSIHFDAKSTTVETRFDLKNIPSHQVENLELHQQMGGTCFFLIRFEIQQETYLLPHQNLKYYWDRQKPGKRGTNSIPYEDFLKYGFKVQSTKRVVLDYLRQVDNLNHILQQHSG